MDNKKSFFCFSACFNVKSDKYNYNMLIKRRKSGAFAYGDKSTHILKIYDAKTGEFISERIYDTRYDNINGDDVIKWLDYWALFIFKNWVNKPVITTIFYDCDEVIKD